MPPPAAPPDSGLGAGAITGIIIGSLAAVALVAFAVWYFFMRRGGSGSMGSTFPFTGTGAAAGSHEQVDKWSFKSLLYGEVPDYASTGDAYAEGGGGGSMWLTPGNPLGLSWLSLGLVALAVVLAITGASFGIAAAAGAFAGDSNSTAT